MSYGFPGEVLPRPIDSSIVISDFTSNRVAVRLRCRQQPQGVHHRPMAVHPPSRYTFLIALCSRGGVTVVLSRAFFLLQQNRARLVAFYQQHNPDKLKDVSLAPKPLSPTFLPHLHATFSDTRGSTHCCHCVHPRKSAFRSTRRSRPTKAGSEISGGTLTKPTVPTLPSPNVSTVSKGAPDHKHRTACSQTLK